MQEMYILGLESMLLDLINTFSFHNSLESQTDECWNVYFLVFLQVYLIIDSVIVGFQEDLERLNFIQTELQNYCHSVSWDNMNLTVFAKYLIKRTCNNKIYQVEKMTVEI